MKRMLQGMKQKFPNTGKKNVQGVRKYFYVWEKQVSSC